MDEKNFRHGAFSWHELLTTDPQKAQDFYTALFNWDAEPAPMEGEDYTVLKADGRQVGGIMPVPPECTGTPPMWGLYVTVDDVDETAARVDELGGRVLRAPDDIPGVGRFAVIQDPQGAVLSVITYAHTD